MATAPASRFDLWPYLKTVIVATAVMGALFGLQPRMNEFVGAPSHLMRIAASERTASCLAQKIVPLAGIIGEGMAVHPVMGMLYTVTAAIPLVIKAPAADMVVPRAESAAVMEKKETDASAESAAPAAANRTQPPMPPSDEGEALTGNGDGSDSNVPRSNVVEPSPATPDKPVPPTLEADGWTVRQPDDNFTLQLFVSSTRDGVEQFVRDHAALPPPLARFEQLRDGERLHVLVQGSYPGRATAEAASRSLVDLNPWVRDFASVKQVMAKPLVAASPPPVVNAKDTAWVWSQNPIHYTIQLTGASEEASLKAAMSSIELPGELAVVQTLREGRPWYVLVYGRFNSRETALAAIKLLPVSLQVSTPWARTFASLQEETGRAGIIR